MVAVLYQFLVFGRQHKLLLSGTPHFNGPPKASTEVTIETSTYFRDYTAFCLILPNVIFQT